MQNQSGRLEGVVLSAATAFVAASAQFGYTAVAAVVARVPGRPIVGRATATLFVLGDVRRHLRAAQILAKSRVS